MKNDNTFRFILYRAGNPKITDLEASVRDCGNVFDNSVFLHLLNYFLAGLVQAGFTFEVKEGDQHE